MENSTTAQQDILRIIEAQREYFQSGATRTREFRKQQLGRLRDAIRRFEPRLYEALMEDLHKSEEEAYLTEISIVLHEIGLHRSHLKRWMKPRRAATPLKMFPSRSFTVCQPLGSTLIISPWNYPVHLLLNPLVGAISSGCTAILKASPYVPHVTEVLAQMIRETFDERYIALIQGHRETNTFLLAQRFDLIFFTGSPALGKTVMKAAAEHLTPVVLELGGKSPCIVDRESNWEIAAKRIAWGKTLNAGQTCIAPDYLLVHSAIAKDFADALRRAVEELHGHDVQQSRHYVRMVSDKAFRRVSRYLEDGNILWGGHTDPEDRYIEPTLLDGVKEDAPVLQEEIFGPVFPMLTFDSTEEAVRFINRREKPLALYYFGMPSKGKKVIAETASGGACINDTIIHIANAELPFGGTGNSGMGHYHGRCSFEAFSHRRAVVMTDPLIDLPFRYMPYRFFRILRRFI